MRFELTLADPLPTRLLNVARICCSGGRKLAEGVEGVEGERRAALEYVREVLDETRRQVLGEGEDAEQELLAVAAEWRARDDGSTVHLTSGAGSGEVVSYACSAEACALAYRHSQLAVLCAAESALAAKAALL